MYVYKKKKKLIIQVLITWSYYSISTGQFTIQKTTPLKTDALVDPMSGATASASISILGQDGAIMAVQNVASSGSVVRVGASMSSGVVALLFAIFFL